MTTSTLLAADTNLGTFQGASTFGQDSATGTNALTNLESFLSNIIGFLTVLAGIFFIIYFVLAAFKWLTAGGDSGKVQKARDEMIQGVMGLIIIVAAYGIIGVIGTILGLNLLQPAQQLSCLIPGASCN